MESVSGFPFESNLRKVRVNVDDLVGMVRLEWMGRRRRIGAGWL